MAGLLNIGTRALLSNQLALQTAGNNVANVNTPGYSRQSVLLQSVDGPFTGAGYYGNGVEAATVLRNHSEFLTRQAALTGSLSASDAKRLDLLKQLEGFFQGGKDGLGTAVTDMLNAFSGVASAPADLIARATVLSRAQETAARFSATANQLTTLQQGVQSELRSTADSINSLATRIAGANAQIANAQGSGHAPNDLLDQRDELLKQLGALVQTTNLPAGDGSVSVFVAGSQPLVLGRTVATVGIAADEFGDAGKSKLTMTRAGASVVLDEATLGGGALSGLLRFQNSDLVDAANMLGRMALALGSKMNEQQRLGLDLNGAPGGNLFSLGALPNALPAGANSGGATVQVGVQTAPTSGATALAASDYEMTFTSASSGSIRRISDGQVTAFGAVPAQVDGLDLQVSGAPAAGDRFLVTPFRRVASSIDTALGAPRALAMASPVAASAGPANRGTLTLQSLLPRQANVNLNQTVTLTFTGAGTFDVAGTGTGNPTGVAYAPGQAIGYNGWALTLKGSPQVGDTYTVQANAYPAINGANAEAMLALRDLPMFDGAPASDGYASLMTRIGVTVQSAGFAASVSKSIATNTETDRAAVSGVNLDEEAAKLLQFQQAYQASAKMLQVAQTVFDTLIQNLAR